jgi:hypothetical protein
LRGGALEGEQRRERRNGAQWRAQWVNFIHLK